MNLLLNQRNVVVMAGDFTYELLTDKVIVYESGVLLCEFTNLNSSNCTTVIVPDNLIPVNVCWNFKYVNGEFVTVDSIAPSPVELTDLLMVDLPREVTNASYPEAKVNLMINIWKTIIQNNYNTISVFPDQLRTGLFLIDTPDTELTETQLASKKFTLNTIYKLIARFKIEQQIGDTLDQLANTDKQLNLILPVAVRCYELIKHLFTTLNLTIPEDILPADKKLMYDQYSNNYLESIANGTYIDRIDVEPNIESTMADLLTNNVKIALIIQEYKERLLS